MPMEDDDLFCTRCGKEVPGERAGKTPETSDGRKDYGRDDYDPDDYDDEEVDEEYEEYEEEERGSRFDRGTIIMLSAAAVLLLILGVLLFNIMHISNPGKDSTRDDEIAVYNNESGQEQNLNEGQQTPASGPSEETSEDFCCRSSRHRYGHRCRRAAEKGRGRKKERRAAESGRGEVTGTSAGGF